MADWSAYLAIVFAALAGLIAGAFGGLRQVLDAYMARWKKRIDTPALSGVRLLAKLSDLYGVFEEAKSVPVVERALVFVGHNCGGLPEPGKRYTVRAQIGWGSRDNEAIKRFAFDLEIDEEYARILNEVNRVGFKLLEVEEMPPSLLRQIYKREKVKYSALFRLCHDQETNEFGYASFASYTEPFSEDDLSGLSLVSSRLRNILNGDDAN